MVVFKRFVRLQSECTDDEIRELWGLGIAAIEAKNGRQDGDLFQDIRLNAGSYQNIDHLHLKIWMGAERFNADWEHHSGYQALQQWREQSLGSSRREGRL